jgi:hypothetical protein
VYQLARGLDGSNGHWIRRTVYRRMGGYHIPGVQLFLRLVRAAWELASLGWYGACLLQVSRALS